MSFKNYLADQAKEAYDKRVEFIDIREQEEFDQARIPGAKLLPMSEINRRIDELPKDREVVIYCRTGNRSSYLLTILVQHGFSNLINLDGGIVDWHGRGYPVEE